MDLRLFIRSVLLVAEKNMRIYYYKGAVVIFGLLFPFLMFLTFFIGRNLNLVLFFPAFLGMMLFFSSSSTGPLITPWEKREKTYERLLSLPVTLESIILGDILAGALFGIVITTIVWSAGTLLLHLPLAHPLLLAVTLILGGFTFAALGTLLSSPAMSNPSNVMMVSNLIRLPLIFVSGIFIPLSQLGELEVDQRDIPAHLPRRPVQRGDHRHCGLLSGHGYCCPGDSHRGIRRGGKTDPAV